MRIETKRIGPGLNCANVVQRACRIADVKTKTPLAGQTNMFWTFHLLGWALWGIVGKYLYTRTMVDEIPPNYAAYVAFITVIGMILSLALRYLYKALWRRPLWLQAAAVLAGSALAGYLWIKARGALYYGWMETAPDMVAWAEKMGDAAKIYEKVSFVESYAGSITVMLAWSVLYVGIKSYQAFQDLRESALKSAAMAHEAQLKMLRYQLNPHFLFNTLNAISTLILERNTELANHMVTRLSSFLRYSLDNDPLQKITLAKELEALQLYLDIEKVRFEDRLSLQLDIDDAARNALIPSLLLQPLIENAIKYGIARSEEGGHLKISARVSAGELQLELSDDGPGCELADGRIPNGGGVGLANTRERLATLYGGDHSIRLSKTEPHGLTVSIRIPYTPASL